MAATRWCEPAPGALFGTFAATMNKGNAARPEDKSMTENLRAKPKVLVCEDEAIILMDLCMMLEECGCEVVGQCVSAQQGLQLLSTVSPDAAILDVRVKDGDVFPLARKLRDSGVGIIFHSGHAVPEQIHREYPAANVCTKPTAAHTLMESVLDVVGAKHRMMRA